MNSPEFEFTAEHLQLLRQAHAVWNPGESGAPAIFFGDEFDDYESPTNREDIICTFISNAQFKPGEYTVHIAEMEMLDQISEEKTLEITENHLKLLRHTCWENGSVNVKRPYGDMTAFVIDMADILDFPTNSDGNLSENDGKYLIKLHEQLLFVLQAFLEHANLSPGKYSLSGK